MTTINSSFGQNIKTTILQNVRRAGKKLLPPLIAVVFALLVCGVLIFILGYNPINTYLALFDGALATPSAIGTTIIKSLPLLIGGLAVTIAYRAQIFNIGVEGQILMGGVFATLVGTSVVGLPAIVHIPLTLLAGMFGGMLWSFIPGWLKAMRGINEVIITLLMNYIAVLLLSWAVRGPLRLQGQEYAKTANILSSAELPILIPQLRLHPGIFIALILLVAGYWFLWHTVTGFNIRFVGANPRAAEASGINVKRTMLTAMLISGSLAGLAGAIHLLGSEHRMLESYLTGYGYDSIATALVGQLHPFGVLVAGFFFGGLRAGSNSMQVLEGIPVTLIYIIQALIILFILSSNFIRFGKHWVKQEREQDIEQHPLPPSNGVGDNHA
ncbi:MAG: ABC transporter permease [Chloroflexi bacterium]|nr:ABC transporter permease [Chloroflexota bacterium]